MVLERRRRQAEKILRLKAEQCKQAEKLPNMEIKIKKISNNAEGYEPHSESKKIKKDDLSAELDWFEF